MEEIKVGIIGLGGMANYHMEQMAKLEGITIVALCDSNVQAMERVAAKLNISGDKLYAQYTDLIADSEVAAVMSITPNDVHFEIIKACLLHNKPLMTEKPFTRTYKEALELYQMYEADPIPCMVGFSYRYVPSFRYARDLIRDGKLGAIRSIFVQYLQSWGVPMFNTQMNWRYNSEISGTGALADLGSHMVDAARFLIGEFEEVTAQMKTFISQRPDPVTGTTAIVDVDDFTGFLASLDSNVAGVFQTSRNAYGSGNQLEVTVYGELGTLSVSCEKGNELTWIRPNAEMDNPSISVNELHKVPPKYEISQMQDFFDMLRGQHREELPTLRDGYANQEVLEAIHQAAIHKKTIELAEFRNKHFTVRGDN